MDKRSLVIKSALASLVAASTLAGTQGAFAGNMSQAHAMKTMPTSTSMEKCYGINAAFKNDCQSPGHSCAGQDKKARDPSAFLLVPAGLCHKIAGGSTTPGNAG